MLTVHNHDYLVPVAGDERLKKLLTRSPWQYERGSGAFLVPGFALESFGLRPDGAVASVLPPTGSQAPYKACQFDLLSLPATRPLWKFQEQDVLSMVNQGAWGEWAQVGLGKTRCALSAFWILRNVGRVDGMLVIGPESARHGWVGVNADTNDFGLTHALVEAGKPIPHQGVVYCSQDKAYRPQYAAELLKRLKTGRWVLVCDECHAQSPSSQRFQAIRFWAQLCRYRWLLSGTPIANYPDKFWSLWYLLTLSKVTLPQWKEWFQRADGTWHLERLKCLRNYLTRISVVRTRDQVAPHLPKTLVRTVKVELTGKQREAYDSMIKASVVQRNEVEVKAHDWNTKLVHLSSICSHHQLPFEGPIHEETSKLLALREELERLEGEKVVVWSWRPRVLQWLQGLVGCDSVLYVGETTKTERERAIHRFNNDPNCRIFFGNPSAAGAGLNLPAADYAIFLDADWSSVDVEQAMGRIERGIAHGQKYQIRFVGAGTVEENIWEAVERKQDLAAIVLGKSRREAHEAFHRGIVTRWIQQGG